MPAAMPTKCQISAADATDPLPGSFAKAIQRGVWPTARPKLFVIDQTWP
ncbi:hypothetical protein F11_09675 [Rhodospirillum rubrum F11]|nr:hypothetical protein [Rhodospirillum rubrum]AEO48401.1 hypothetical protein F11_09675 [Rhodospirillum rubrum F11]QXG78676.1 hypothetical protein KUL73_09740 [Rhodospirillum rubrum]